MRYFIVTTVLLVGALGFVATKIPYSPSQFQQGNFDIVCAPAEDGRFLCRLDFHTECHLRPSEVDIVNIICAHNPLDVMDRP